MAGNKPGTCRFDVAGQKCPYGAKCKFFHSNSTSSAPSKKSKAPASVTPLSTSEAEFRAWRLSIPKGLHTPPTIQKLSKFFQQALSLMSYDASIKQQIIKELDTEGGLRRIREVADQEYAYGASPPSRKVIFQEQIMPLFKVITHPEITDSAMLEQKLGDIVNYIYGPNGMRAKELFTITLEALKELSNGPKDDPNVDLDDFFTTPLAIFAKIVDTHTPAQVNESLVDIVKTFEDLMSNRIGYKNKLQLHDAVTLLSRIQHRLGLGSKLPSAASTQRQTLTRASFVTQREGPGGRNNNDFEDIVNIKVMPTYDEIISDRTEYLPLKDLSQNHLQGLNGLLDRHFRLLREDTIGQLRDAVKGELVQLQRGASGKSHAPKQNGARIYAYKNLRIEGLHRDAKTGFKLEASFDQLACSGGEKERKAWWLQRKRLDPDALVCLVNPPGLILFAIVDDQSKPKAAGKPSSRQTEEPSAGLYFSPKRAHVFLALEDPNQVNIVSLIDLIKRRSTSPMMSLVEFPGILLPAFKPTLLALQQMKTTGHVALSELILPSPIGKVAQTDIPVPTYVLKQGFRFNLRCLLKNKRDLFFTPGRPFDIRTLQKESQLDDAQAVALVNSLSKSLALIQGPPGTGKSFVGVALIRTLLANKRSKDLPTGANIGPIIVVCYTNHALDQLLEHLHHDGVTQIIRMGGQSKSELLKDCNLRSIAMKEGRTRHEKYEIAMLHKEREGDVESRFSVLDQINHAHSPISLKKYLLDKWPHHHNELFKLSEGEWEVAGPKKRQDVVRKWLTGPTIAGSKPRDVKALMHSPLLGMSRKERHRLYAFWESDMYKSFSGNLVGAVNEHQRVHDGFKAIYEESDLRCLREANIIGVTTSGLARNLPMLRKLKSQVLVCEEAGEVLEAHILTTFLPSITHAILIGDHQQLRPQIQNYELSSANPRGEQYSLDISLFERLVHPSPGIRSLPYNTLKTQRRMHPSVSRLIRETLYPELQDADTVTQYPEVAGMRKRLFWLDHTELEAGNESEAESTSRWNKFEVEMTTALVRHLVSQGAYQPDEIAVITPYLGQLQQLRKSLSQSFAIVLSERDEEDLDKAGMEDSDTPVEKTSGQKVVSKTTLLKALRIATVDNFQGEEAKVILLSLVRSNPENKCGFLNMSNRINVAISRAKHGMYIIGNSRTASSRVSMWADIVAMLTADGNIGTSLELQCPRHPDTPISVSTINDFPRFSPEGGCSLKCADRLQCGHACKSNCHSKVLHDAVRCLEPCPRSLKGCDHSCPNYCGDSCISKCRIDSWKPGRVLPCGHIAEHLPCWQSQDLELVCCMAPVKRSVPGCSHIVTEPCHIDVTTTDYTCRTQCGAYLPCGHTCRQQCRACTTRTTRVNNDRTEIVYNTQHRKCAQVCGRKFTSCSHSCKELCHGDRPCSPCRAPCENRCSHSKCPKLCSEPCRPCAEEKCPTGCPHSRCTLPCAVPCNHIPCEKRCAEVLACGHQCPSVCGEACPAQKFCQVCCSDDVRDTEVDYIMFTTYAELNLDESPCIFPSCGHFFTTETMDGQMEMSKYYEIDQDMKIIGRKPAASVPFSCDEIKKCGQCRVSFTGISRYGRLNKRAMIDEATKRFIVWANAQYIPLVERLQEAQEGLAKQAIGLASIQDVRLQGSPEQQIQAIRKISKSRYGSIGKLRQDIVNYRQAVSIEEQPFKQVLAPIENARRRRGIMTEHDTDDNLLQTRSTLLSTALLIRCELSMISDVLNSSQLMPGGVVPDGFTANFAKNREICESLVTESSHSSNRLQEIEGHIYFAQFAALERRFTSSEKTTQLNEVARAHLAEAKILKEKYPGPTKAVHADLDAVERMLRDGTFYEPVTSTEMRAVVAAMAVEFSGTGHWYYCVNGHPFTIGECGMPMQQARCPQCGEAIGGQSHQAVAGVRHASDLEAQFGQMNL